jgi:beta-glucosidase
MKHPTTQILGGLLLPFLVAAQNSTTTTNSTTEGLLSSGNVELGDWADAYSKATSLVAKLTNSEKITLITGGSVSAVNWTALEFKDSTQGPQGMLYFPTLWRTYLT